MSNNRSLTRKWKTQKHSSLMLKFNHILYGDLEKRLLEAASEGNAPMVRIWCKRGANIHDKGNDALLVAEKNGHINTVAVLLKLGADYRCLPKGSLTKQEYFNSLIL